MSSYYNKYTQPREGDTGTTRRSTKARFERELEKKKRSPKVMKGRSKKRTIKKTGETIYQI